MLGSLVVQGASAYLSWQAVAAILVAMVIAGTYLIGVPWMKVAEKTGAMAFAALRVAAASLKPRARTKLRKAEALKSADLEAEDDKTKIRRVHAKKSQRKKSVASERYEPVIGTMEVERELHEADLDCSPAADSPIEPELAPNTERVRSPRTRKSAVADPLPSSSLLDPPQKSKLAYSQEDIDAMSTKVEQMLAEFGVQVSVENAHPGPVITQLEVLPAPGVKASQIVNLSRDLARSLSVSSVRVVDNIPGSSYVGIEVPNRTREIVRLIDGLESDQYASGTSPLTMVLGKDIQGGTVVSSLEKMPHLLIAGTTGAGKSVCLNAILLSFLYKSTHESLRLIMIDPKMLEFSVYEGIPHLLTPVITDMEKTENALRWCIAEMELRYDLMSKLHVRNLNGLNELIRSSDPIPNPQLPDATEPVYLTPLPHIVVVIDELADLIMVMGRKAEDLIIRIAQRARAAGIHLIVATQRPSTDVIKGLLKANIPTRIGFKVASNADSRTILDQPGAETLLGQGDMLFIGPGTSDAKRVHGAFVSDDEVKRVVDHWKNIDSPNYLDEVVVGSGSSDSGFSGNDSDGESDELYDMAVDYVIRQRRPTISSVQRQFRIGYNRAARIIESMESAGVVSPADPTGRREVLVPPPQD